MCNINHTKIKILLISGCLLMLNYEISISKIIISIPTAMIIMLMRFSFAEPFGVHLTYKKTIIKINR